jgi:hypothetical protein
VADQLGVVIQMRGVAAIVPGGHADAVYRLKIIGLARPDLKEKVGDGGDPP